MFDLVLKNALLRCSICHANYRPFKGRCWNGHTPGVTYQGKLCVVEIYGGTIESIQLVSSPAERKGEVGHG